MQILIFIITLIIFSVYYLIFVAPKALSVNTYSDTDLSGARFFDLPANLRKAALELLWEENKISVSAENIYKLPALFKLNITIIALFGALSLLLGVIFAGNLAIQDSNSRLDDIIINIFLLGYGAFALAMTYRISKKNSPQKDKYTLRICNIKALRAAAEGFMAENVNSWLDAFLHASIDSVMSSLSLKRENIFPFLSEPPFSRSTGRWTKRISLSVFAIADSCIVFSNIHLDIFATSKTAIDSNTTVPIIHADNWHREEFYYSHITEIVFAAFQEPNPSGVAHEDIEINMGKSTGCINIGLTSGAVKTYKAEKKGAESLLSNLLSEVRKRKNNFVSMQPITPHDAGSKYNRFCTACGEELQINANFCGSCGSKVA